MLPMRSWGGGGFRVESCRKRRKTKVVGPIERESHRIKMMLKIDC